MVRDTARDIAEKLGMDGLLCQLSEECAELIQAAAKVCRARNGHTPVPLEIAMDNLVEEIADVNLMIDTVLDGICSDDEIRTYFDTYARKERRMEDRLLKEEEK